MSEALRGWIIGIAGAAMIAAAAMTIAPEGKVKKVVSLICGLMTVIALLKPVVGFSIADYSKYLTQYKNEALKFSSDIEGANDILTKEIIEDKCEAYILDKGKSMGISDLAVQVTATKSEDGYWYPQGAQLTTAIDAQTRGELTDVIEADLGIPPEELIWS